MPALLAVALAPWFIAPGPARDLLRTSVLLMAMWLVWLLEQLAPRVPEWNARPLTDGLEGAQRLWRDAVYLFGVTQLTAWLVDLVDPWLKIAAASSGLEPLRALWPADWPFALRFGLAFLLVEFFSYWVHRAAHRTRLLWQFHSTHHVATELNGLKAVRTHPVDNLAFFIGRTLPLLAVGAGREELLAAASLGGVLGILAHANLDLSDAGWGLLVNYPQTHAVHHSANLVESNSNFGCHTVLWDRLFGTFRRRPQEPLTIGVDPVGPRTLWQELMWPFYRRVS